MAKKVNDGWHKMYDYEVRVDNEMVTLGISPDNDKTVYPYRWSDTGRCWCIDQAMSLSALRSAYRRGSVRFF